MKVYSPSDIASLLDVKESTLRKYSLLLEEYGYTFQRNRQKQRWYSDNDVIALRKLVTLKNNGDMSLKECAEAVYLWSKGEEVTQPLTVSNNGTERYNKDIAELKELIMQQNETINKQNDLMQELSKQLKAQQEYIDKRLNERDQTLLHAIDERMETQKQIAATNEKQSIFKRLFGK